MRAARLTRIWPGPLRTWPLPALGAWALSWAVFLLMRRTPAPPGVALAAALGTGLALSMWGATRWRRVFIASGFPLSLLASGAAVALPAWGWLMPMGLLLLVYPLRSWRDAPLFPTPAGALDGLAQLAPLAAGAQVLDAGCGLGAGLRELRRAYPEVRLHGLEWSALLRLLCALRCRFAQVRRGDIWLADWSGFDLVYVFQRPESMARAYAKAQSELRPGGWLASLEFEVPGHAATQVLHGPGGRPVWLYRCG